MKAALIGLGNIAWRYDARTHSDHPKSHAGTFLAHPKVDLVGGCSPDAADREDFVVWSDGLPAYESIDVMLGTLQPDIVGVCSPTPLHFEHVARSISAGVKLIWLEKAPASTVKQVDQLIELADENKATVCVNYIRRYAQNYSQLCALYQSGKYGKCHAINVLYSPGLVRNGSHLMDFLFSITGAEDFKVHAVLRNGESPHLTLELDNGIPVQVTGGNLSYHTNTISLICDEGILTIANGGDQVVLQARVEDVQYPGFHTLEDRSLKESVSSTMGNYMGAALDNLISSYETHAEPRSSLRTARLTQRLLDEVTL
jgi:predicted dehydrogenase